MKTQRRDEAKWLVLGSSTTTTTLHLLVHKYINFSHLVISNRVNIEVEFQCK